MSSTVNPPADARSTRIILMPYNPDWRERFLAMGQRVRRALGERALRVDHHGATAVPGVVAKPVIDILVTVASLEPTSDYVGALESLGLTHRPDDADLTRQVFTGDFRGVGMANLTVREAGTFTQQFHLLFRDFLRADVRARQRYSDEKEKLANNPWITVDEYGEAKGDIIWTLVRDGQRWAAATGWRPGASDV